VLCRKFIELIRSRKKRWVEHVAHNEELRKKQKILVGKSERKRQLETSGRRVHEDDNNIKTDIKKIVLC
jgi:hypothetical protein